MPIYAPSLPPRPALDQGLPPALVIARFDLRRIVRQRLGKFFIFIFLIILIIEIGWLWANFLSNSGSALSQFAKATMSMLPQDREFHSSLLTLAGTIPILLWFQVAIVGGGLISRDTLYRTRPLIYAHPVRPLDYLTAKLLVSIGIPFLITAVFVFVPWLLSILIAWTHGPIKIYAPLFMLPAALLTSTVIGAVTLGASSLASSPRAAFGWVIGISLGINAISSFGAGLFHSEWWWILSPQAIAAAWPDLCCGVAKPMLSWAPTLIGTFLHIALWTYVAARRTRPSEAVL